jgi:hypothetical protein
VRFRSSPAGSAFGQRERGGVTRLRFALLVLPLALLAGCGGPSVPPAANYGSISGRVYDATTNQPIAGVLVSVDTILNATTAVQAPSGYAAPNFNAPPYSGSIDNGQTITVDIPLNKS